MRIGIVDDLALAREALRRLVQSHPGFRVAWVAEDGYAAVRQASLDPPDVILMDLIMPGLDGAEATRRIKQTSACPILIVTATVAGNYPLVLQAMSHGALDAFQTPQLGLDGNLRGGQELLARLERIERMDKAEVRRAVSVPVPYPNPLPPLCPLVALGASTGGPEALAQILSALPATFPAAIVVIQHIDVAFATGLADWLRHRCTLPLEVAREGGIPKPGVITVAATNDHLVLRNDRRFHYTPDPAEYPYRPSVNAFFESLHAHWPRPGVAVLLTGMGRDGACGLAALRQAGWLTVAQDEATSVVYGMPRAAVEMNAASRILPLGYVAAEIVARIRAGG